MNHYDFKAIERKWQQYWEENRTFSTTIDPKKPKYYVLDMFPYPSGEGLHVGHPLGYIASDIVSRYKRSKGYAVLHPMGFDAFGLPAEQFAIQTGQHPAVTTIKNTQRYKEQLKQIGLSYDWDREINTSNPDYYKWTQWIFLQLFNSWYDTNLKKARPIGELVTLFEQHGNEKVQASCDKSVPTFNALEWQQMDEPTKQHHLLAYRLAFLENTTVNWCPELGTVLANEEVKDGVSERGGYPVVRKQMKQWSLRITAYADRLLEGLDHLKWPLSTKEMQRNWIGKSTGAEINFTVVANGQQYSITIFTTRPDTIFGVSYLALSPEHPLAKAITTPAQEGLVQEYIQEAVNRSERDRLSDVKHISGVFTGAYALHPLTSAPLPIWIADYILGGYGTGAIMGVPAHDNRDHAFSKHFNLPIISVIEGSESIEEAYEAKEGILTNSDFLNGCSIQTATEKIIQKIEELKIGSSRTTYRLRNAIFSRQRYWGEPFPIYYKSETPYPLSEKSLPLALPAIASYKPTPTGEPPLGNVPNWKTEEGHPLELSTMPGWAGSSWYFFRYMDPNNSTKFVAPTVQSYWQSVDLYIGGAEHATGHLLYARFWTKFLYDLGHVNTDEPFQELIHQGMIQNKSSFVYRIKGTNQFVSYNLRHAYETTSMHVDIHLVKNDVLDLKAFKSWRPDLADATFILEDGHYICGSDIEKMSKSKHNTINPDTIVEKYGADTLRLYTMFLGPIDQAKPWDTHGIEGVFRFLVKVWRLFYSETGAKMLTNEIPAKEAQKVIHKTIKKVEEDIKRYTFNTAVSNLMICVNELTTLKCTNQAILKNLVLILAPFAPHLAEELWQLLGHMYSVTQELFPCYEESYVHEESYEYPVAVNGKVRAKINFDVNLTHEIIQQQVLAHSSLQKWLHGQTVKKFIIIPQKMINIVI